MEATRSSEMSLAFQQTTWRYIAEAITLAKVHKPRHERYYVKRVPSVSWPPSASFHLPPLK
jgi:hypothetical protein